MTRAESPARRFLRAIAVAIGAIVVAFGLMLTLTGCSSVLTGAVGAVNASHQGLDLANTALADMHRQDRDAAVADAPTEPDARAALSAVHARYRPIWAAYSAVRAVWLAAEAATLAGLAAEAAGQTPDAVHILATLDRLAAAWRAFEPLLAQTQAASLPPTVAPNGGAKP